MRLNWHLISVPKDRNGRQIVYVSSDLIFYRDSPVSAHKSMSLEMCPCLPKGKFYPEVYSFSRVLDHECSSTRAVRKVRFLLDGAGLALV